MNRMKEDVCTVIRLHVEKSITKKHEKHAIQEIRASKPLNQFHSIISQIPYGKICDISTFEWFVYILREETQVLM